MIPDLRGRVLRASGFHAPIRGEVEGFDRALLEVRADGAIGRVLHPGEAGYDALQAEAASEGRLVSLPAGSWLLPGFVDLHVHAPQYPQLGRALHVPLEVWLRDHTFPLEARYADLGFALRSYRALVADLLANGTTTAVYFATIHRDATRLLVDTCLEFGQRALVGKVAMDNPEECPHFYRDASAEAALDGTRDLVDYVRAHPGNGAALVHPAVTPRFVPSCTDPLLAGLGALAEELGCHVQTHCSESDWQHGYVLARYGVTDTTALDRFGLLRRHTVLAHGVLIEDDDMGRIRMRGSGIAHCPLSNIYFSNAVFPLRTALDKGLRVGLGTDISGGPSASLFDGLRMAVHASRLLEEGVDPLLPPERRARPGARIDVREAFHLATAGGADVLDLPVGRFVPGCRFDAMVIDTEAPGGTIRLIDEPPSAQDLLQTLLFTASRPNIAEVWVEGRRVAGAG